jgi:hypothetical protein
MPDESTRKTGEIGRSVVLLLANLGSGRCGRWNEGYPEPQDCRRPVISDEVPLANWSSIRAQLDAVRPCDDGTLQMFLAVV